MLAHFPGKTKTPQIKSAAQNSVMSLGGQNDSIAITYCFHFTHLFQIYFMERDYGRF
jgi:hypothetical protein